MLLVDDLWTEKWVDSVLGPCWVAWQTWHLVVLGVLGSWPTEFRDDLTVMLLCPTRGKFGWMAPKSEIELCLTMLQCGKHYSFRIRQTNAQLRFFLAEQDKQSNWDSETAQQNDSKWSKHHLVDVSKASTTKSHSTSKYSQRTNSLRFRRMQRHSAGLCDLACMGIVGQKLASQRQNQQVNTRILRTIVLK